MTTDLSPIGQAVPFVGIDAEGRPVRMHPAMVRWFEMGLGPRVGGNQAPSNNDLEATQILLTQQIVLVNDQMLSGQYDDAGRVADIINTATNADLPVKEIDCWDINYYLPPEVIVDARNPTGPTINATQYIRAAHDYLIAKFISEPTPGHASASFAGKLRFHNSYLYDGGPWNTGIGIEGDNFRDTIFVQSSTSADDMFRISSDNGATSGGRSPYWVGRNFSILMKGTVVGPGKVALNGISFDPPAVGDPLGHNSGIMELITITGASGSGISVPSKRHGPKIRFCYVNGCGVLDQSIAQDDSGHAPNILLASDSDGELLHSGSGSGKGHSLWIHNCETTQVKGGDYWASSNAALDYRAIFVDGIDYFVLEGFDCNGAVEYQGQGASKSSQARFVNINFRFFPSSFGDDDTGSPGLQPAPLVGFLILKNSMGSRSTGCTFTPYYHGQYGPVEKRPQYIYQLSGVTMHFADDQLQDIASNDWPAGADSLGNLNPSPTYATTITNDWTRLSLTARNVDSVLGFGSLMLQHMRFVPGVTGGVVGRTDGTDAPTGMIGQTIVLSYAPGSAVALTTATNTDLGAPAPLPAGSWHVYGTQVFVGNAATTISGIRGAITSASGTIPATSSVNYRRRFLSLAGPVNFDFDVLEYGPIPVNVPSGTTNIYSTVRADFTSAAGTVGAWGDLRAVRVG